MNVVHYELYKKYYHRCALFSRLVAMDPKQNETYKLALAHINQLEQQLNSIKDSQIDLKSMEEQIEVHFNKCVNFLAARKDQLLRDLAEKASTQRKMVEEAHAVVQQTVQAQRDILNAGATVFKFDSNNAEHAWKGVLNMKLPQYFGTRITLDLPDSLSKAIQDHGKVLLGKTPAEIDFSNPKVVPFAGYAQGLQDGLGAEAKFTSPYGICWSNASNCFFVCDYGNNAIRKITLQGVVSTFIQGGQLKSPHGIVIHEKSNDLFITNQNGNNILKITSEGLVSVVAGSGLSGSSDGIGIAASFKCPNGIAIDQKTGDLFISDYQNHLIRKITSQGVVSTLAGSSSGYKDGQGTAAQFNYPWGLCYKDGSLYVCDSNCDKIRRVSLNGEVTTVCEVPVPSHIVAIHDSFLVSSVNQHKIFTIQGETVSEQKISVGSRPAGIAVRGSSCYVVLNRDHSIVQINYS